VIRSPVLPLLTTILFLVVLLGMISTPRATATVLAAQEYRLRLFHVHSGERLDLVYRRGDRYVPEALIRLDEYLKDWRTGDVLHYDPRLFDLLHDIATKLGHSDHEVDVVCGYRSPWSNEFLRRRGHHVARRSLHMQAMAVDIRISGVSASRLRDAALALHRGGVGYYADSAFVHVDVGRVRRWSE
jgi:uncharacterized protein YcbK (DUF882 family)